MRMMALLGEDPIAQGVLKGRTGGAGGDAAGLFDSDNGWGLG